MSRDIKFRAYIKIEEFEGYYYPKDENDFIQFIIFQNGWGVVDCNDNWLKADEFIIEQYTGLKDKNGVEIYEGDIVKKNEYPIEVKFTKSHFIKNDCWISNGFLLPDGITSESNENGGIAVEIIGNIHEKPESLEES